MKKILLGALLMASLNANSQSLPLPSDSELKASYCIAVKQKHLELIDSILRDPSNDSVREFSNKSRADTLYQLDRLKKYLIPRMFHLDPTGLVMARQSAEADIAQSMSNASGCFESCGKLSGGPKIQQTCSQKCFDNPITKRFAACNDLTWMPY